MRVVPEQWAEPGQRVADASPWWLNAIAIVLGGVALLAVAGVAGEAGLGDDAMLGLLAALWFAPAPVVLWVGHRTSPWPCWRNALWVLVASPWLVGLGLVVALGGLSTF